jgi:ABC-2 type transport system ATP-binding protein
MMEALFRAERVNKSFTGHQALKEVSIDVPEGSIFGLLGPNGAGKTTLIRIINQITAPDSGSILLKGKPLKREDVYHIGYLPEERGLYKKMKVGEQALYLAQLKGLSRAEALKRLREWFTKFEIENWWNKKVEELSKGMQQKVQFIVTIVHQPDLIIFDEPFSGFDPINVNLLKSEILNLKAQGSTIIFSTHNMASVEELCDHIVLINKAQTILKGSVQEIKQAYKSNTFEADLTGLQMPAKDIRLNGYEVLGIEETLEGVSRIRVSIPTGESPNSLLKALLQYGELHGFREIIPSMNDIFIQRVNEDKARI